MSFWRLEYSNKHEYFIAFAYLMAPEFFTSIWYHPKFNIVELCTIIAKRSTPRKLISIITVFRLYDFVSTVNTNVLFWNGEISYQKFSIFTQTNIEFSRPTAASWDRRGENGKDSSKRNIRWTRINQFFFELQQARASLENAVSFLFVNTNRHEIDCNSTHQITPRVL